MKITNIRVLNNYKVKLTNAKLSGVNSSQSSIFEQGTRTPVIITQPPTLSFQEKFDIVLNYLINRYEPGWSAATPALGKAATMQLLGISSAINPLVLGGTVENAFNYSTNSDEGWFDPLTHPKDFASTVLSAYKNFERARSPQRAANKFVQYNLNGIFSQDFLYNGGNAFFGYHPKFDWYPGNSLPYQIHMGYSANYDNCIRRSLIHSPYGNLSTPMNFYFGNWRRYPWLTDRYTAEAFQFDMYLLMRENTTVRDLLSDHTVNRNPELGVIVDGVTDIHLNTLYRGICFDAGAISIVPFNDYGRTGGGYSADRVLVGSPWIRFPDGITYSSWWGGGRAGLCFHYDSLLMFNGNTFPSDPQILSDSADKQPMTDVVGLSFGYGETLLESLNELSETWGNSMEFIAYLGCLPYGTGFEMRIPFALYKDPTLVGNKNYFKWRLDASVSHWKEKFKSPFDGFAHVVMDASAVIERTYHKWQDPGYTFWTNSSNGISYAENIPVEWARDQYNYTFGDLGPNTDKGVILGVEKFAEYMFKDDVGLVYPNRNDQRRFPGDTNPRHWCLDDDKASDLFSTANDVLLGQRKWTTAYSNSVWGMGVCGSSKLGEIFTVSTPEYLADTNKSAMSAFSCFYNTFIEVENDGDIKWKRVPGTIFNNGNDGVPWINDRRFRLFYLYPTMLALNTTIVDYFHDGIGYYNHLNKSGWYDKSLGNLFESNMEANARGSVVSDFPYPNRRTPTKPAQNFWTGIARTSEFELLYACMKGGITAGLDSLYFNELCNELTGIVEPPNTSRTGFFRALDFTVFAASWSPANTDDTGQSLYPSIVPLIHPNNFTSPTVNENYFRYQNGGPGNTSGLTGTHFEGFKNLCEEIPVERRVVLPRYWLLDGPPGTHREPHYYFKRLADGTTYTGNAPGITFLSTDYGGTWQYGDTNPLRYMTPWAYENRSVAKDSFRNFLRQCLNDGIQFKYLHDDNETSVDNFSLTSSFLTSFGTGAAADTALTNFASGSNSFKFIPDARSTSAIVSDSRFNGITNETNSKTWAQDFKDIYNELMVLEGFGACGASAEQILSYYTDVSNRNDFKNPFSNADTIKAFHAWNATNYTFCLGDLKSKIIGETLKTTPGFVNTKVTSSESHVLNTNEARYAVDSGGFMAIKPYKLKYNGHSHSAYGRLEDYLVNDYGYPPTEPKTDAERYGKDLGWHNGGITFGNHAYQAFVADQKVIRGILRSRPTAPQEGFNLLTVPNESSNISLSRYVGEYAREYIKENILHSCLSGVNYFIVFNSSAASDPGEMGVVNDALVEWKNISGNVVGTPCDYTGATGGTVDRIDLYQAGRNLVISGAYTNDPNKRLWRITVPPFRNVITRTDDQQTELPQSILIPNGSRGVWLEAPASYGKPQYESGIVQSFFFGNEFSSPAIIKQPTWFNKSTFGMGIDGDYRQMKNIYEANLGNTSEVFYETSMFTDYPLDPPNNPRTVTGSKPFNFSPGITYVSDLAEFKYRSENSYYRENGATEEQRVIAAFNKYFASTRKYDVYAKYKPDILEFSLFEVLEQPLLWRSNVQIMTPSGMTAIGHTVMLDRCPNLDLVRPTVNLAHERGIKVLAYFKPMFLGLNRTFYPEAKAITGYPQRYYINNIVPRTIFNPEYKRVVKEVMEETVRPQSEGGLGIDALQWDYNFVHDEAIDFSDYAIDIWAKHKGYAGRTDAAYITWAFTENNFPFPNSGLTMGVLRGITWMYRYGDQEGTATFDLINNPNITNTQKNNILEYNDVLTTEYENIIKELALAVETASYGNGVFLPANDLQIHRAQITQHEILGRYAQGKKTEHMVEPRSLNRLRPRNAFYSPQEYLDMTLPGANQGNNPPISVLAGTKEAEKAYADINVPDANTMFNIQYKTDYMADFKASYSWHEMTSAFINQLPVGSTGAVNDAETFNTLDYLKYPSGGYFFLTAGWGREDCIVGYLRGKYQKNLVVGNSFTTFALSSIGWLGDVSRNDAGTTGDAYYNPIRIGGGQVPRPNYSWYRKMMYHHRKYKEIIQNSQLPFEFKKPYCWLGIHMPPRGTILPTTNYMGNFADAGFRYIKQHLEPELTNGAGSNYTYKTNSIGQNFGQYYHPIAGCVDVCESNMIPYSLLQNIQLENNELTGLGIIVIPHREFITESLATKLAEFEASGGKVLYMDEVFGGTAQYDADDPRLKGRFYDLDSRDSEKQKLLNKILEVGGTPPAFGTITSYEYDANNPAEKPTFDLTKVKCSSWWRYSNVDKNDSFVIGVHLLNDMNWMDDRKNGIGGQGANYSKRFNELDPATVPNKQSTNPKLNGVLDIDLWGYGPNWRSEYNALPSNPDPNSGVPWPLGGATGATASMFYPERELYWGKPLVGGYNGRYWSCMLSIELPSTFKIESAHKFYIDQENEPNDLAHEEIATTPIASEADGMNAEHIAFRYDSVSDRWKVYVNNIGMHADVRFKISPS
jgi:hypothetical protein